MTVEPKTTGGSGNAYGKKREVAQAVRKYLVLLFLTRLCMAQNGGPPELPEAVSKPPEGIVLPPKDIRGE